MSFLDTKPLVGVIGGSGLYDMAGLDDRSEHHVQTPFGEPSDAIVTGKLNDVAVAFLSRHGRGHRLLPAEVNYRANIYALKSLGISYLIGVSAVGSLRENIHPLDVVIPHQYINLTKRRESTFFGDGAVAHVSLANPVCQTLAGMVETVAQTRAAAAERSVHAGGTYVTIEGPQFSTRAESTWYRSMGADVIGMTNQPEAALAREASLAYATLATVTDYDCWHPEEDAVTAEIAIARLQQNAELAQRIITDVVVDLGKNPPSSEAHNALAAALVTQPDEMTAAVRERLRALLP